MPAVTSAVAACNPTTWRANLFSPASTAQRVAIIVVLSGGVKHCCDTSPASLYNLFALFELVQKFIQLVMIRIFDDQLATTLAVRLNFHAGSKPSAHFFLQPLGIAAELVRLLWFVFFRLMSLLLNQLFRFAHGKPFQHNFIGQQYLLCALQRQQGARMPH